MPVTPGYVDFDYDTIGGGATVAGLRTCWDGFSDSTIDGDVVLVNNQTVEPDGNFVGGDTIAQRPTSPPIMHGSGWHRPGAVASHRPGAVVALTDIDAR